MTTVTHSAPKFHLRSTHSALRALTVIVLCAAVIGGFIVQVLKGPSLQDLRTAAEPTAIHLRA